MTVLKILLIIIVFNLKPYRIYPYQHTYPKEIFLNVMEMFYRIINIHLFIKMKSMNIVQKTDI